MVRVRNINLEGLLQIMSLTSANWKSFYNPFLYEKKAVNSGMEPLTSNLQLSTLSIKPLSHSKGSVFLDSWTFMPGHFWKFPGHFLMPWALYER